jgi:methionyl-tRNA formyltransferase
MKTVFMGTPETAAPFLNLLCGKYPPDLVLTQPDRPKGRGLALTPSPVKTAALAKGLRVETPKNSAEIAAALESVSPDLAIIVAYGRLLKKDALSVPKTGCINIHFSLLPEYRGAAPVQWALINGETKTGVTSFWLDEGMDTGPVCLSAEADIAPQDDAASLMQKLVTLGLDVLSRTLDAAADGGAPRLPQRGEPSHAPMLSTAMSFLDFDKPAAQVCNLARGLALGPHARVRCPAGGRTALVQVIKASPAAQTGKSAAPGTIVRIERPRGFIVQCNEGEVLIEQVRPEGKKTVSAWDFVNGLRLKAGDIFAVGTDGIRF